MITKESLVLVRGLVQENPFATYDEIEAETHLYRVTINHILHDCLKMRKATSHWVPHLLNDEKTSKPCPTVSRISLQIQKRVKMIMWCSNGGWVMVLLEANRSQTNKRQLGGRRRKPKQRSKTRPIWKKTMYSILFRTSGIEQITYRERGAIITSEIYIEDCLKPLVWTLSKQSLRWVRKSYIFIKKSPDLMWFNRS